MIGAGNSSQVTLLAAVITAECVPALRHAVTAAAAAAGLAGDRLEDFVLAVNELTTNAVRHGGGSGHLVLRRHVDRLTCQVSDDGPGMTAAVPTLPDPTRPGRRGLWLAENLTDGLVLDTSATGTTATVTALLDGARA